MSLLVRNILAGSFALIVLWAAAWSYYGERGVLMRESRACDTASSDLEKVDCWLALIIARVRTDGIERGYTAFRYVYNTYPVFGATGCHQHAHRVGDAAYYELFVARGLAVPEMEFPQETVSCGYGFYHGFIEHLIQDRPDPAFVAETCEYLRGRYSGTMRDIGTICYHASGHGFTMAKADTLRKSEWGSVDMLIQEPLAHCERLDLSEEEIEDCREGVFNVISDWAVLNNFGLVYDFDDPFGVCRRQPERWRYPCYYEIGMKLEPVLGDDPVAAATYVQDIEEPVLRQVTYGVIVAGMMQRAAPEGRAGEILEGCLAVDDATLRKQCVHSMTNGIMEHGSPGSEYKTAAPLCERLMERGDGLGVFCFETLGRRLKRFYPPEKVDGICVTFPEEARPVCGERG